jgi:hypothetical protein
MVGLSKPDDTTLHDFPWREVTSRQKANQEALVFDEGKGLSTGKQLRRISDQRLSFS